MADPAPKRMTVDEYLAWATEQPKRPRFELHCGEVYAMAPERVRHALTKRDAMLELMRAIRAAGVDCEVFPDGATVVVDDHSAYEPDVTVQCGGTVDLDKVTVDQPLIVVEVLSPSSQSLDGATKYRGYFRVASIRHYLILDPIQKSATHHFRSGERIESAIADAGHLVLDPPGIEVNVEAFFAAL
jgi:Uma2 family endonuclease